MCEYIVGENQQQNYTFTFDPYNAPEEVFLRFSVESDAHLMVRILIAQVSIRIKIECILRGTGAYVNIYGAYVLSDEHVVTIDTMQHHHAAHTSSTLVMKGALRSKSSVRYRGIIRIEKEARSAYALQENKNILLSGAARAISIPQLEVLNNEVKCFHGSAMGKFDAQLLFYMASRGIDEATAQRLLLDAFFADVVDGEVREKMKRFLHE